ncbi:MAG: methyltransferase domain-containing protein [Chloroflexota bacterium]
MNGKNESTSKQIAERYGQFADQALETNAPLPVNVDGMAPQSDSDSEKLADRLYSQIDLIDLPEPAVNASIGCGNPFEIANLKPGETVLDLGSGGGIDCFIAAKSVSPNGYVIGVDVTPSMIELANKNKRETGAQNVEFRLGTIEQPPVDSETIDVIISNCVIDISPNKQSVFEEAYRVLKPGGRMAISDTILLGEIEPKLKANIDQWSGAVVTPLISLQEFLSYIDAAGFVDIRVDSLTSYGLENFDTLDEASQKQLTAGIEWKPLPEGTGLFSAAIWAQKP